MQIQGCISTHAQLGSRHAQAGVHRVGIWCGFTNLAPAERSSIKAMQVKSTTSMLLEAGLSGSHADEDPGTGSHAAMRATFIAQGGAEGGGSGGH